MNVLAVLAGNKWQQPLADSEVMGVPPIIFILVVLLIIAVVIWIVRRG